MVQTAVMITTRVLLVRLHNLLRRRFVNYLVLNVVFVVHYSVRAKGPGIRVLRVTRVRVRPLLFQETGRR